MTGPCFVDANVFIYARDPRDPRKQERAAQWIDLLWRERLGRTSAQAIAEFYAVATRKLGIAPERVWPHVERYFAWKPHPVDEDVLRRARETEQRYRLSWWDSTIVAAAQLQDCVLLLTEDLQDGAVFGAVTVRSPFTLQVSEAAATYAFERRGASLHRPRGRPKRAATASA
jgi:predicted nucleic acid-binding protein